MNGKLVGVLVVGALAGLAGGYYVGVFATRSKLEPILEIAYPRPPEEVKRLDGMITEVGADYIKLEMEAIEDYLPHPDGSPRVRETRTARIGPKTEIILVDYGRPDETGRPRRSALTASQVRPGYYATVKSEENIRRAVEFTPTRIEITAESETTGDLEGLFEDSGAAGDGADSRLTPEDLEALFR